MRQATGSNTPQSGNKVSIQLSLDGHSFSVAAPPAFPAEAERIEAEVLTPRTMLVPVEYFAGERAAALLAANGMPALSGEETVCSNSKFSAIFCSHGTRGARPGPGLFLAKIVQERRNAKFICVPPSLFSAPRKAVQVCRKPPPRPAARKRETGNFA